MLITFAILLFIIPAITGLGFGTIWILRGLNVKSPHRFDVLEPIVGLATLAVVVNLENLLFPVSRVFALALMAIGWVLFLYRVWHIRGYVLKPLWIGLILVWVAIISTQAVLLPANHDSGLYHIPTIRWLVDSPTPLGLGNLHGRLAFNSSWFSVSAVLAQAAVRSIANYTALASEALLSVVGIAILGALYKLVHSGANKLSTIFLLLCGVVGFAPLILNNISSPSTDDAVLLLALMLAYVFLRAFETNDSAAFLYEFWLCVVLTLFLVTIKVSILPLILVPLSLFLIGYRRRLGVERLKNLLPAVLTTLVVMSSWMMRGLVLSGCLAYPLSITCFPGLPWTVSRAFADSEALWIQSWARAPGARNAAQIVSSWDWFGPWLGNSISSIDFILPLVCLGVGLILNALFWRRIRARRELMPVLVLVAISLLGMLYWFLSAPSLRFGSAWFWLPGILALSLPVLVLRANSSFNLIFRGIVIFILILWAFSVAQKSSSSASNPQLSLGAVLFVIPPLQVPKVISQKTTQGISINSIEADDRCYWVPMCAANFSSDLEVRRAPGNRLIFIRPWVR